MRMHVKHKVFGLMLALMMGLSLSGWAQLGKIHGSVKASEVATPGAKVTLLRDGSYLKGMMTDSTGLFEFALLDPGSYSVNVVLGELSYQENVNVSPGESQRVNVELEKGVSIGGLVFTDRKEIYNTDREVRTMDRKEIGQLAGPRDLGSIVSSTPGIVQKDHGDPLNFKGARDNANATYFDNQKIRGSDQLPLGAIEQVSVMTGGVPAEYGDVLGAVIVVTTRNPGMAGYKGALYSDVRKQNREEKKLQRKAAKSATDILEGELDLAYVPDQQ
jgi:hypothetical protein